MQKAYIGQKIIHLERVGSTNNYTANLFKNGDIDSGTVIMTDIQTNGRGQREKAWQSDAYTNLTFSIATDINKWKINSFFTLNHITALATHQFIQKYIATVALKWPNDVMVNDKKMAGILIETQFTSSVQKTVIGIGININQRSFTAPRATSLLLETGQRHPPKELVHEFIEGFNEWLSNYHSNGENWILDQFNQRLWKKEEKHQFLIDNQEKVGEIQKTTPKGQLVVEIEGELNYFSNGEVRY